ncbi:putative sodium/potassium/calcium exchanger CG1090 isoform X1 [Tachypleus tridentatus]|uniref:putative sodium/potassium/calcium exchanger CG1090 isoform X1 n=1 Tax=Tachypleus tridentatus TaxID=6853 RepID=UPI003FD45A5B
MRRRQHEDAILSIISIYTVCVTICCTGLVLFFCLNHILITDDNTLSSFSEDGRNGSKPLRHLLEISGSNCTPPGIEQFPKPMMRYEVRRAGGLAFHIFVALYMFLGLAIVCDKYFVSAVEKICEVFKMKSDVAGATFMAAGSSAPELATAVIGVFIAKDDIGIGTVVGSAVYNIAFVISICGLFAGREIYLNWWPLFRDCFFYLLSIFTLLWAIYNEEVSWLESLVLLSLYGAYIAFMFVNERVEKWVKNLSWLCELSRHNFPENSHDVAYKHLCDDEIVLLCEDLEKSDDNVNGDLNKVENFTRTDDVENVSPFHIPQKLYKAFMWAISLPITVLCYFTIPDCRLERWKNWYMATFLMSCVWISGLCYILVWFITIIGFTLHIPDTVMGLTFLAAGVSVPDAISSLLVVQEGMGDMAISNAVGSNVFDILLCLGLPWFFQTAVMKPGSFVKVYSKGLTYSTVTLISTVVFLLVATHCNGWKLDRKYGVILFIWYLLFMVLASLYELNIFGYFNPPECPSNY